jgi:hypothetical protein
MLLDPDPHSKYGSGSKTAKSMQIHTDSDPLHLSIYFLVQNSCFFYQFPQAVHFLRHLFFPIKLLTECFPFHLKQLLAISCQDMQECIWVGCYMVWCYGCYQYRYGTPQLSKVY